MFDSLAFRGRTSISVREIARKLACTSRHVLNLIDDGSVAGDGMHTVPWSRNALRVPVGVYERFLAERLTCDRLPDASFSRGFDGAIDFPDRSVLTIQMIAPRLGVSERCLAMRIETGTLLAVDIKTRASDRHCYRIPVEAYRQFLAASSSV